MTVHFSKDSAQWLSVAGRLWSNCHLVCVEWVLSVLRPPVISDQWNTMGTSSAQSLWDACKPASALTSN